MAEMATLQCTLDSFHVLSLFFGGKWKIIGGYWELWELAFRMYDSCHPWTPLTPSLFCRQLILVQIHWKAATRESGCWEMRILQLAGWWREWLDTYLVKLFPPLHQSASFPQCASAAAPAFVVASLFNPIIANPPHQTDKHKCPEQTNTTINVSY